MITSILLFPALAIPIMSQPKLSPITAGEVEAILRLVDGYDGAKPPMTFERRFDDWIGVEIGEMFEEPSRIEFRVRGCEVSTRTFRLSKLYEWKRNEKVTRIILDSFSRVSKAGYRSHGFDMWVRHSREGWFVLWNKLPRRFHDDMTVYYSADMVYESQTRGRG